MTARAFAGGAALLFALSGARAPARAPLAQNVPTALVERYLRAMRAADYVGAYALLDDAERAYYRNARNLGSIYTADSYRITAFRLLGARGDAAVGRVYFARETATFRDHAHDIDLTVTATVPVGVVPQHRGWRIKDPGHPWRAFAAHRSATVNGVRVTVKKLSFFARRIETVVTFQNDGPDFVTILAYGKSILHDAAGNPYPIISTRDWSLTDKALFEGLYLAPRARYTGVLAFESPRLADPPRTFSLRVAPLLAAGGEVPFAVEVNPIAAAAPAP